jgi:hypothetical protein
LCPKSQEQKDAELALVIEAKKAELAEIKAFQP